MEKEKKHLPKVISDEFGLSMSEGRRLIAQNAVKVDGKTHTDLEVEDEDFELQVGKTRKARIESSSDK